MFFLDISLPKVILPDFISLIIIIPIFVAALGEELGWSGFILEIVESKLNNSLYASIVIGIITAFWHIIPFIQANRSFEWIVWQCLTLLSIRVLTVWIYHSTNKSVLSASLFHMMVNLSWLFFPNGGSHYDPRITGLLTGFLSIFIGMRLATKK